MLLAAGGWRLVFIVAPGFGKRCGKLQATGSYRPGFASSGKLRWAQIAERAPRQDCAIPSNLCATERDSAERATSHVTRDIATCLAHLGAQHRS